MGVKCRECGWEYFQKRGLCSDCADKAEHLKPWLIYERQIAESLREHARELKRRIKKLEALPKTDIRFRWCRKYNEKIGKEK